MQAWDSDGGARRGGWARGIRGGCPPLRHATRGTSRVGGGGREGRARARRAREGATRRGRHAERGGGGRQRGCRVSPSPAKPGERLARIGATGERAERDVLRSARRETCCAQRAERSLTGLAGSGASAVEAQRPAPPPPAIHATHATHGGRAGRNLLRHPPMMSIIRKHRGCFRVNPIEDLRC
jgi:hypothetical protein